VATVPSIKVVKTIPFKGGLREFSNRYHFNGGTPADATHWHTLMDNVVAAEKLIFDGNTTIVDVLGYAAGSEVPVAEKTYSTVGTNAGTAPSSMTPGEVAALVRYSTAARTSKNHPIYLFNYYHRPYVVSTDHTTFDKLGASTKTLMDTYAGAWISGFSDGTLTLVRASPNGAAATGHVTEEYVTHRDFPYTSSV